MSNPIPKRLLIHAGSYKAYAGMVGSNPSYGAAENLDYVRFEAVRQDAMTSLGDMKADRFVMFFDCHNSKPKGLVPSVKSVISFGGVALTVRKVTACYGSSGDPHHYEVNCV